MALTVSAIRYGLDLHLGKVDPKALHKDFDPDSHTHDPGAYLWKNVVGAQSVKEALAPIESSYPCYQRTLVVLQKYMQMEKEEVLDPLRLRVHVEIAHQFMFSQSVSVMNLEELSKCFQISFDGLLGQDILNQFRSVRIDYKAHVIELER